jgi:hypothetical protein
MNAAVGRRERATNAHAIYPYGNPRVNYRGETLLNVMRVCRLVDTLSFHKNKIYDTWASNFDKLSYASDHCVVSFKGQKIKINDVKVTRLGVQSDHLVIQLDMKIKKWKPSEQGSMNKNFTKTKIDYKLLNERPEKQEACNEEITRFVIEQNKFHPDLAELIVELYKKIASRSIDERQDWFQENQTSLLKHIEERNDTHCEVTKKTTP